MPQPPDDDSDVVILVPTLDRAHRIGPLTESIRATCTARVLFLVSPGQDAVHAAIDAAGYERVTVPWYPIGDYARKINLGYLATSEPLIFLGADDLEFLPGWLDAARACLGPGVGVVGTNDLGSPRVMAGEHSTHSLVTRTYADQYGTVDGPGQVLCEAYTHEFVDDELVGTAKWRGMYQHAHQSQVRHCHPNWDASVPTDATYLAQGWRMRQSRGLYHRRRQQWT